MSVFLGAFLGCLLAMFVVCCILGICMIIAIIEYKKKQSKKIEDLNNQFNNVLGGGFDVGV